MEKGDQKFKSKEKASLSISVIPAPIPGVKIEGSDPSDESEAEYPCRYFKNRTHLKL